MFNHIKLEDKLPELDAETLPTGRTYKTPDGKRYPSVTTVLGEESKAGILAWRKRVGEEEANRISFQASSRGTSVHTLAENYINNDPEWFKGAMPTTIDSFNQIKYILDARMNNVYAQEVPLYSDKLEVAGRVDLIAEWDNELAIIDFKTARKPKEEKWIQNYFMQCAFYAAAFYERTGVVIKKSVILITVDHSEPQIFITKPYDYLNEFIKIRQKYRNIYGF
jgi:predicted RecB family nuclease